MRVCEIFESVQGETSHAGRRCAFVRFAGCDLRCRWCDTAYAWEGGEALERTEIRERIRSLRARFVTLTGGEPTLQPDLPELCEELLSDGFEVSVETHGQAPLDRLPAGVARIIDVKPPSSGQVDTRFLNLRAPPGPRDELKFVVADRADFDWAVGVIDQLGLRGRTLLLSPVLGRLFPRDLVRWMLETDLDARLSLQLHKLIWAPETRGV